MKVTLAVATATAALAALFAGLGFGKVGPFRGVPLPANAALISVSGVSLMVVCFVGRIMCVKMAKDKADAEYYE